jgi:hypothetical protein
LTAAGIGGGRIFCVSEKGAVQSQDASHGIFFEIKDKIIISLKLKKKYRLTVFSFCGGHGLEGAS